MKKIVLSVVLFCIIAMTTYAQTGNNKNFQLSFISPFGTNGTQSHLTTNKISINLLGGYSQGNTAFEFGGLYNINTNLTKGIQFAGIANCSGGAEKAIQIAGIANIATNGFVQIQIGGITNVAKNVNVQVGSIVNLAKKVKGVQIGIINIAEDCDGMPIGLISIVKNGGKREFELSFSEAINTAVSFKLGTDKLYTIFSGGIIISSPIEYAAGLGFGTHIDWSKGWGNQIELMSYTLSENRKFQGSINLLTQLKFTLSKQFSPHFKVFAGPVLNMTISDYVNPETGQIGSTLSPYAMWEKTCGKTNLKAWIGLTAGIRF